MKSRSKLLLLEKASSVTCEYKESNNDCWYFFRFCRYFVRDFERVNATYSEEHNLSKCACVRERQIERKLLRCERDEYVWRRNDGWNEFVKTSCASALQTNIPMDSHQCGNATSRPHQDLKYYVTFQWNTVNPRIFPSCLHVHLCNFQWPARGTNMAGRSKPCPPLQHTEGRGSIRCGPL